MRLMATETSSASGEPRRRAPRSFDLRERKRTRTRLMIQVEALRLFAEQGYAETTVEEIADAAAISPRTFFRYFPTKEDVVLWDEYDPRVPELLDARPADEPAAETIRAIIRETLGGLLRRDPEELLTRVRLLRSVPELRARFLEMQDQAGEMIAAAYAPGPNRPDEVQLRVTAAALSAAVSIAIDQWQKDEGKSDLLALFEQTIDALTKGLGQLQPSPQPKNTPTRAKA
jgi:AcrR family transcriptional regulator